MGIRRRRFLTIAAAAAGMALPGLPASAGQPVIWRGQALGAPAQLILNHPDRAQAARLLTRTAAELRRLERIFTLYDADSDLSRLNAQGVLAAPSPEMVALLGTAARAHRLTGGRFDPTVQPLWVAYAQGGADPAALDRARGLVGFGRVAFDDSRISLPRGGALTLNGIAQGYITDRIVAMLRAGGAEHTLVDMGEIRAIGPHPDGRPWRVGAGGEVLPLADRALATTEPAGFSFDPAGGLPHLIDPGTGRPGAAWSRMTVIAPEAALADALSTGFCLAGSGAIRDAADGLGGIEIHATGTDGRRLRLV